MGNQPGVARMDTSAPDGTPSASRRKSTEKAKDQRLSVDGPRGLSDQQESLLAARAILSDIVNCVVSERSPQPVEAPDDRDEGVIMNKTLSPHSLNSYLSAAQCVPEEDCANRTFTFEAEAEESPRPAMTSANGVSDAGRGSLDTAAVIAPASPSESTLAESAPADTALRLCALVQSAAASACVPLTPEKSGNDADLVLLDTTVAGGNAAPLDIDQVRNTPDSVSEPRRSEGWHYTDASDASLPGVGANKSELDLTFATAKGSPLGAARYFDASSLHTATVAPSEDTEVNHSTGPVVNESCDQEESFRDILPKNALELKDCHLEASGNVTCVSTGDVSLLQDSGNATGSTPKLLSSGLIEEILESPNNSIGLFTPSDLQEASTPSTEEDLVPRFYNHCSVQSPADACNKSYRAEAGSDFETPTHTHCEDETVASTATDSNENLLITKDAGKAEITVTAKDPAIPAAGLGKETAAHTQPPPDKGTTEGTLPVDSEAGPEVAQFTEEEHRAAAVYFKEDLDFLQKVGSSRRLGRTSLGRCSLFLKFDPLFAKTPPKAPSEESRPKKRCSVIPRISEEGNTVIDVNDSGDLLNLCSPSPSQEGSIAVEDLLNLCSPSPSQEGSIAVEEQMFSEKEMSQALKYQELMFQERLLKKDQDCVRQLDSVRQEAESLRGKLEESQKLCQIQERALQCLERHNESLVGALNLLGKDLQKERAEREESLQKMVRERDQLVEDLHNVEITFADFHRRYEKAKQVISVMKENEAILKKQVEEAGEALEKNCHMVHVIKTKTEESIEGANKEMENTKRNFEADITVLKGQLKKAAMTINSLEKRLEQKSEENSELTKLYDDLLNQVKAK